MPHVQNRSQISCHPQCPLGVPHGLNMTCGDLGAATLWALALSRFARGHFHLLSSSVLSTDLSSYVHTRMLYPCAAGKESKHSALQTQVHNTFEHNMRGHRDVFHLQWIR
jgi:hypothetical protein